MKLYLFVLLALVLGVTAQFSARDMLKLPKIGDYAFSPEVQLVYSVSQWVRLDKMLLHTMTGVILRSIVILRRNLRLTVSSTFLLYFSYFGPAWASRNITMILTNGQYN